MENVPDTLVQIVQMSLEDLLAKKPIVAYELVMSARDRSHVLFGIAGEELLSRGLIESQLPDGTARIHDVIREVIVTSFEGEDMDSYLHRYVSHLFGDL